MYPIFATFKAYETYSRVATKATASSVSVGGVSIPLGTMLKRATEGNPEEDFLSSHLLIVQMWVVYWIVHGSISVVELVLDKFLFVSYLPFYSSGRLALSLWLLFPIFQVSNTIGARALSHTDLVAVWSRFSSKGAGLVYYSLAKPFMEGQLETVNANLEHYAANFGKWGPLLQAMQAYSTYTSFTRFLPSRAAEPARKTEDLDDYDVVDKPSVLSSLANVAAAAENLVHRDEKKWW